MSSILIAVHQTPLALFVIEQPYMIIMIVAIVI